MVCNLENAYDNVNREMGWNVLKSMGLEEA